MIPLIIYPALEALATEFLFVRHVLTVDQYITDVTEILSLLDDFIEKATTQNEYVENEEIFFYLLTVSIFKRAYRHDASTSPSHIEIFGWVDESIASDLFRNASLRPSSIISAFVESLSKILMKRLPEFSDLVSDLVLFQKRNSSLLHFLKDISDDSQVFQSLASYLTKWNVPAEAVASVAKVLSNDPSSIIIYNRVVESRNEFDTKNIDLSSSIPNVMFSIMCSHFDSLFNVDNGATHSNRVMMSIVSLPGGSGYSPISNKDSFNSRLPWKSKMITQPLIQRMDKLIMSSYNYSYDANSKEWMAPARSAVEHKLRLDPEWKPDRNQLIDYISVSISDKVVDSSLIAIGKLLNPFY